MFSKAPPHPGRQALDHIRRVLDAKPRKDDHELSFATQDLARYREEMLAPRRLGRGGEREAERLSHLNAIIAVVMAMHFPVGQPPWAELEKAQGWLRDLVGSDG